MGFDEGLGYIHEVMANFIFHVIEMGSGREEDNAEVR